MHRRLRVHSALRAPKGESHVHSAADAIADATDAEPDVGANAEPYGASDCCANAEPDAGADTKPNAESNRGADAEPNAESNRGADAEPDVAPHR